MGVFMTRRFTIRPRSWRVLLVPAAAMGRVPAGLDGGMPLERRCCRCSELWECGRSKTVSHWMWTLRTLLSLRYPPLATSFANMLPPKNLLHTRSLDHITKCKTSIHSALPSTQSVPKPLPRPSTLPTTTNPSHPSPAPTPSKLSRLPRHKNRQHPPIPTNHRHQTQLPVLKPK
jgi:hypothetical protein